MTDDQKKLDFSFLPEAAKKSVYRFPSHRELGLKPNELPYKFRVDINADTDDETEISRKRSLLRLNSSRLYSQLGYIVRAFDSHRVALQSFLRFASQLDEEEAASIAPILSEVQEYVTKAAEHLKFLREAKIEQSVKMEETLEKASNNARKARIRLAAKKKPKNPRGDFWVMRLPDSLVDVPIYGDTLNPFEVFEQIRDEISAAKKLASETNEQ